MSDAQILVVLNRLSATASDINSIQLAIRNAIKSSQLSGQALRDADNAVSYLLERLTSLSHADAELIARTRTNLEKVLETLKAARRNEIAKRLKEVIFLDANEVESKVRTLLSEIESGNRLVDTDVLRELNSLLFSNKISPDDFARIIDTRENLQLALWQILSKSSGDNQVNPAAIIENLKQSEALFASRIKPEEFQRDIADAITLVQARKQVYGDLFDGFEQNPQSLQIIDATNALLIDLNEILSKLDKTNTDLAKLIREAKFQKSKLGNLLGIPEEASEILETMQVAQNNSFLEAIMQSSLGRRADIPPGYNVKRVSIPEGQNVKEFFAQQTADFRRALAEIESMKNGIARNADESSEAFVQRLITSRTSLTNEIPATVEAEIRKKLGDSFERLTYTTDELWSMAMAARNSRVPFIGEMYLSLGLTTMSRKESAFSYQSRLLRPSFERAEEAWKNGEIFEVVNGVPLVSAVKHKDNIITEVQLSDGTVITRGERGGFIANRGTSREVPTEYGDIRFGANRDVQFVYQFEKFPSQVNIDFVLPGGRRIVVTDGSTNRFHGAFLGIEPSSLEDIARRLANDLNFDVPPNRLRLEETLVHQDTIATRYSVHLNQDEAIKIEALLPENSQHKFKIVSNAETVEPLPLPEQLKPVTRAVKEGEEKGEFAYRIPFADQTATATYFFVRDGELYVGLAERGNEPFKGQNGLIGGFAARKPARVQRPNESASAEKIPPVEHPLETFSREASEETGADGLMPKIVKVSAAGADPRARVIDYQMFHLGSAAEWDKMLAITNALKEGRSDVRKLVEMRVSDILQSPKLPFDHFDALKAALVHLAAENPNAGFLNNIVERLSPIEAMAIISRMNSEIVYSHAAGIRALVQKLKFDDIDQAQSLIEILARHADDSTDSGVRSSLQAAIEDLNARIKSSDLNDLRIKAEPIATPQTIVEAANNIDAKPLTNPADTLPNNISRAMEAMEAVENASRIAKEAPDHQLLVGLLDHLPEKDLVEILTRLNSSANNAQIAKMEAVISKLKEKIKLNTSAKENAEIEGLIAKAERTIYSLETITNLESLPKLEMARFLNSLRKDDSAAIDSLILKLTNPDDHENLYAGEVLREIRDPSTRLHFFQTVLAQHENSPSSRTAALLITVVSTENPEHMASRLIELMRRKIVPAQFDSDMITPAFIMHESLPLKFRNQIVDFVSTMERGDSRDMLIENLISDLTLSRGLKSDGLFGRSIIPPGFMEEKTAIAVELLKRAAQKLDEDDLSKLTKSLFSASADSSIAQVYRTELAKALAKADPHLFARLIFPDNSAMASKLANYPASSLETLGTRLMRTTYMQDDLGKIITQVQNVLETFSQLENEGLSAAVYGAWQKAVAPIKTGLSNAETNAGIDTAIALMRRLPTDQFDLVLRKINDSITRSRSASNSLEDTLKNIDNFSNQVNSLIAIRNEFGSKVDSLTLKSLGTIWNDSNTSNSWRLSLSIAASRLETRSAENDSLKKLVSSKFPKSALTTDKEFAQIIKALKFGIDYEKLPTSKTEAIEALDGALLLFKNKLNLQGSVLSPSDPETSAHLRELIMMAGRIGYADGNLDLFMSRFGRFVQAEVENVNNDFLYRMSLNRGISETKRFLPQTLRDKTGPVVVPLEVVDLRMPEVGNLSRVRKAQLRKEVEEKLSSDARLLLGDEGLLSQIFPNYFGRHIDGVESGIIGRPQTGFHQFPVDEHQLRIADGIRQQLTREKLGRDPFPGEIINWTAKEHQDLVDLTWVALFHDLMKQPNLIDKDHEWASASVAWGVLKTLGYSENRIRRIVNIVEGHRELSYDPAHISARLAQDSAYLDHLAIKHIRDGELELIRKFNEWDIRSINDSSSYWYNINDIGVNVVQKELDDIFRMVSTRAAEIRESQIPIFTTEIPSGFRMTNISHSPYGVFVHRSKDLELLLRNQSVLETQALSVTLHTNNFHKTFGKGKILALVQAPPENISVVSRGGYGKGHSDTTHESLLLRWSSADNLERINMQGEVENVLRKYFGSADGDASTQFPLLQKYKSEVSGFTSIDQIEREFGAASDIAKASREIYELLTLKNGKPLDSHNELKIGKPNISGIAILRDTSAAVTTNATPTKPLVYIENLDSNPEALKTLFGNRPKPEWLHTGEVKPDGDNVIVVSENLWKELYERKLPIVIIEENPAPRIVSSPKVTKPTEADALDANTLDNGADTTAIATSPAKLDSADLASATESPQQLRNQIVTELTQLSSEINYAHSATIRSTIAKLKDKLKEHPNLERDGQIENLIASLELRLDTFDQLNSLFRVSQNSDVFLEDTQGILSADWGPFYNRAIKDPDDLIKGQLGRSLNQSEAFVTQAVDGYKFRHVFVGDDIDKGPFSTTLLNSLVKANDSGLESLSIVAMRFGKIDRLRSTLKPSEIAEQVAKLEKEYIDAMVAFAIQNPNAKLKDIRLVFGDAHKESGERILRAYQEHLADLRGQRPQTQTEVNSLPAETLKNTNEPLSHGVPVKYDDAYATYGRTQIFDASTSPIKDDSTLLFVRVQADLQTTIDSLPPSIKDSINIAELQEAYNAWSSSVAAQIGGTPFRQVVRVNGRDVEIAFAGIADNGYQARLYFNLLKEAHDKNLPVVDLRGAGHRMEHYDLPLAVRMFREQYPESNLVVRVATDDHVNLLREFGEDLTRQNISLGHTILEVNDVSKLLAKTDLDGADYGSIRTHYNQMIEPINGSTPERLFTVASELNDSLMKRGIRNFEYKTDVTGTRLNLIDKNLDLVIAGPGFDEASFAANLARRQAEQALERTRATAIESITVTRLTELQRVQLLESNIMSGESTEISGRIASILRALADSPKDAPTIDSQTLLALIRLFSEHGNAGHYSHIKDSVESILQRAFYTSGDDAQQIRQVLDALAKSKRFELRPKDFEDMSMRARGKEFDTSTTHGYSVGDVIDNQGTQASVRKFGFAGDPIVQLRNRADVSTDRFSLLKETNEGTFVSVNGREVRLTEWAVDLPNGGQHTLYIDWSKMKVYERVAGVKGTMLRRAVPDSFVESADFQVWKFNGSNPYKVEVPTFRYANAVESFKSELARLRDSTVSDDFTLAIRELTNSSLETNSLSATQLMHHIESLGLSGNENWLSKPFATALIEKIDNNIQQIQPAQIENIQKITANLRKRFSDLDEPLTALEQKILLRLERGTISAENLSAELDSTVRILTRYKFSNNDTDINAGLVSEFQNKVIDLLHSGYSPQTIVEEIQSAFLRQGLDARLFARVNQDGGLTIGQFRPSTRNQNLWKSAESKPFKINKKAIKDDNTGPRILEISEQFRNFAKNPTQENLDSLMKYLHLKAEEIGQKGLDPTGDFYTALGNVWLWDRMVVERIETKKGIKLVFRYSEKPLATEESFITVKGEDLKKKIEVGMTPGRAPQVKRLDSTDTNITQGPAVNRPRVTGESPAVENLSHITPAKLEQDGFILTDRSIPKNGVLVYRHPETEVVYSFRNNLLREIYRNDQQPITIYRNHDGSIREIRVGFEGGTTTVRIQRIRSDKSMQNDWPAEFSDSAEVPVPKDHVRLYKSVPEGTTADEVFSRTPQLTVDEQIALTRFEMEGEGLQFIDNDIVVPDDSYLRNPEYIRLTQKAERAKASQRFFVDRAALLQMAQPNDRLVYVDIPNADFFRFRNKLETENSYVDLLNDAYIVDQNLFKHVREDVLSPSNPHTSNDGWILQRIPDETEKQGIVSYTRIDDIRITQDARLTTGEITDPSILNPIAVNGVGDVAVMRMGAATSYAQKVHSAVKDLPEYVQIALRDYNVSVRVVANPEDYLALATLYKRGRGWAANTDHRESLAFYDSVNREIVVFQRNLDEADLIRTIRHEANHAIDEILKRRIIDAKTGTEIAVLASATREAREAFWKDLEALINKGKIERFLSGSGTLRQELKSVSYFLPEQGKILRKHGLEKIGTQRSFDDAQSEVFARLGEGDEKFRRMFPNSYKYHTDELTRLERETDELVRAARDLDNDIASGNVRLISETRSPRIAAVKVDALAGASHTSLAVTRESIDDLAQMAHRELRNTVAELNIDKKSISKARTAIDARKDYMLAQLEFDTAVTQAMTLPELANLRSTKLKVQRINQAASNPNDTLNTGATNFFALRQKLAFREDEAALASAELHSSYPQLHETINQRFNQSTVTNSQELKIEELIGPFRTFTADSNKLNEMLQHLPGLAHDDALKLRGLIEGFKSSSKDHSHLTDGLRTLHREFLERAQNLRELHNTRRQVNSGKLSLSSDQLDNLEKQIIDLEKANKETRLKYALLQEQAVHIANDYLKRLDASLSDFFKQRNLTPPKFLLVHDPSLGGQYFLGRGVTALSLDSVLSRDLRNLDQYILHEYVHQWQDELIMAISMQTAIRQNHPSAYSFADITSSDFQKLVSTISGIYQSHMGLDIVPNQDFIRNLFSLFQSEGRQFMGNNQEIYDIALNRFAPSFRNYSSYPSLRRKLEQEMRTVASELAEYRIPEKLVENLEQLLKELGDPVSGEAKRKALFGNQAVPDFLDKYIKSGKWDTNKDVAQIMAEIEQIEAIMGNRLDAVKRLREWVTERIQKQSVEDWAYHIASQLDD